MSTSGMVVVWRLGVCRLGCRILWNLLWDSGGFGNSLRDRGGWFAYLLAGSDFEGLCSTGDSCSRVPDSWDSGIRLGIAVVWALKRLPTYLFTSIHYLFGNMKIDVPPPIIIEWTKEKENSRIQVCAFAKPLVSIHRAVCQHY